MVGQFITNSIMKKSDILNHTGLTEEQFYAKYKNPDAFFKSKSGVSFKAKYGSTMKKAQYGNNLYQDTNRNGIPDYMEMVGKEYQPQPQQQYQTYNQLFPAGQVNQQSPQNGISQEGVTETFKAFNDGFQNKEGLFSGGDYKNGFGDTMNGFKSMFGGGGGASGATGGAGGTGGGGMGNAGGYVEAAMSIVKGVSAIKGEKKLKRKARVESNTVQVLKDAFDTKDVNYQQDYANNNKRLRKALMPTIDPNTLFPTYGVGTNVLGQAKDGAKLKKANTGLNYGWNTFSNAAGLAQNNNLVSTGSQFSGAENIGKFDNAGSDIGSGIGQAVGTYFGGPLGGTLGKYAGKYIGGALDPNYKKIKNFNRSKNMNLDYMSGSSHIQNLFANKYDAYGENGISFRSGGNLRTNEVGDIEAVSGGSLEPISYNPYSDGSGITSMIKGQSHEESNGNHTGVLMNYKAEHGSNSAQVEAERGEPVTEIGEDAVIFGDMVINDRTVGGDPMFKGLYGKTFKKAMAGVAEQNQKLNKQQTKNTKALNDLDVRTSIDKLTLNSLSMNDKGINTRYAVNDAMMKKAAAHQEVVNNEAARLNINSGDFSRGKLSLGDSMAKDGKTLLPDPPKGAKGNIDPKKKYKRVSSTPGGLDYTGVGEEGAGDMFDSEEAYLKYLVETNAAYDDPEIAKQLVEYFKNYDGEDWQDVRASINKGRTLPEQVAIARKLATDHMPGRYHINASQFNKPVATATTTPEVTPPVAPKEEAVYDVTPYGGTGIETALGQIMPWVRRQPGEGLRTDQLYGELNALTDNEIEPVQARFYHPQLRTPYDISYQDQLNENQADFNQLTDVAGNNPQALAALAAQKYGANSKVLAEQFRQNQAMKENVYSQNIATLNDAQLKNLQIADQQYVRQATAKSNTKAVKQEALSSIASKIGQNRLENRTLQTYANLFPDYSYDSQYRIRKTGAPAAIDIPTVYAKQGKPPTHVRVLDENGNTVDYEPVKTDDSKKQYSGGGVIKAFKDL